MDAQQVATAFEDGLRSFAGDAEPTVYSGRIIRWTDRGFGFIASPQLVDNVFVHANESRDKRVVLQENDDVEFELSVDAQGRRQATRVQVVGR